MKGSATDPWIVLKFGGTSVAAPEGWSTIAREVEKLGDRHRVLVVVSALAGVTNRLEEAIGAPRPEESLRWIEERHGALAGALELPRDPTPAVWDEVRPLLEGIRLTGEATPRLRARILAGGEIASSRIGEAFLANRGLELVWVDARSLLTSLESARSGDEERYLEARVRPERDPERIERAASGARVILTQGFIASTPRGETCLLGRGGSDTSAAILAAIAGASELQIWTDVHGLFTADPRQVPSARLILTIGYREAQELATLGAKVLHPRCLSAIQASRVPVRIKATTDPDGPSTLVEHAHETRPGVTAVTCRTGVTLLTLSTLDMWEASGFLARAFLPFEELGISIDLVGTAETSVSLTIDRLPGGTQGERFERLLGRLRELAQVQIVHPCAVVSIVGRRIRAALPELGGAFAVFQDRPVHLVSNSSEDLNLSFVVDEGDGAVLVERLHRRLFAPDDHDPRFGPTWEQLAQQGSEAAVAREAPWWRSARGRLVGLAVEGPAYVYDLATVSRRAKALRETLTSVRRFYYAMKANPHPDILETVAREGFGIECVSAAEVARARSVLGKNAPILFTPNFCPVEEYRVAFEAGAEVTLDGPHVFALAPDLFRGTSIGVRVDPGRGLGHHEKVLTAGPHAKFGEPIEGIGAMAEAAARAGATIVGLHAHVGSGIFDPEAWAAIGNALAGILENAGGRVRWLDVGGGLGVPEHGGLPPLDLARVENALRPLAASLGGVELRMEPGRYLVAEAGVLVSRVTQVRRKGDATFVGLATGMNSLLRPALYGAWHPIHNLSRLDEPTVDHVHVVGPICESADVLGRDRRMPSPEPGDVLLIENAGAYGAAMASRYNLREPAREVVIP